MPRINPENEARRQRRKELAEMLGEIGVTDVCPQYSGIRQSLAMFVTVNSRLLRLPDGSLFLKYYVAPNYFSNLCNPETFFRVINSNSC